MDTTIEPTPAASANVQVPVVAPPPVHTERRRRGMGWRSGDVVRAAALVMALYLLLRLLWFANELVFIVFLGSLFGLAVARAVDYLERLRIPRGIGAALVVLSTLGALFGVGAWVAPTIREQGAVLREQLPEAVDRVEHWINTRSGLVGLLLGGQEVPKGGTPKAGATPAPRPATPAAPPTASTTTAPAAGTPTPGATPATPSAGTPAITAQGATGAAPASSLKERLSSQLSGATRYLFPFLSSTAAVAGGLLIVLFLSIYIGAEPELYHRGMMHLFPHGARARAGEVFSEMATVLRKWLVTQLIAMIVIGSVTTAVLLALGVKAAVALGLIAGLLEFVPTVGPILSALPAIAMGFVGSPEKALYVLIAYVGIQFLENHLLIPLLMRGGLDLPPALTIVAQALMTLLFGFLGLMVAVPMTAAVMVPIKMLYVEGVVGDEIEIRDDES
jgi:predicted PurR-regulated permease PerM